MTEKNRKSAAGSLPQETGCAIGEASKDRPRVHWFGHVIEDGAMQAVRVHEVSSRDAVLWCFATLPAGDQLTLFVPELGHVRADVAWREGQQIGICFTDDQVAIGATPAPAETLGEAA